MPQSSHPVDPDSFGFLLADVFRLIRGEMDRRIARAGLGVTPAEARLLAHAARAGAVRQNLLAEFAGVEAMTVSGHLDRLERAGLVERLGDPADRRAKLVRLTVRGGQVLAAIRPIAAALREEAMDGLSAREQAELQDMLRRVRTRLSPSRPGAENAA